jgi:hypothetical protein
MGQTLTKWPAPDTTGAVETGRAGQPEDCSGSGLLLNSRPLGNFTAIARVFRVTAADDRD